MSFQSKHFQRVLMVLALVMICLSPVVIQPDSGSVQADKPSSEAENPMITFYAEAMQIDEIEAKRRLTLQYEMSLVEQKIATDEAYFASWMQHQPTFGLVVSFTTADGQERLRQYLPDVAWADLVTVQQSDITRAELASLRRTIVQEAEKTGIVFGSGLSYPTGQVRLYTEKPDQLRTRLGTQLAARAEGASVINRVEVVKEAGAAPADYDYPYLLGGQAQSLCTSGFPVYRANDGLRFISTAGHCADSLDIQYGGANAVYMGNMVWQNDIDGNGPFGDDLDFQVHDASGARTFDLTNRIKTGAMTTQSVIGTETRNSTLFDFVCKYGKTTGHTCGFVDDLDHTPNHLRYGTSDNYVRVFRFTIGNVGCFGDSGGPVFKYWGGGVYALGLFSGAYGAECEGQADSTHFFYSPIDYINWSPYRILTTDYRQYLYQNIFKSAADCTEYRTPVAPNGSPLWPQTTTRPCRTSAPGSGSINTYAAIVTSNLLREAIWQGGVGYVRNVPLQDNGEVDWHAAPSWTQCCTSTAPYALRSLCHRRPCLSESILGRCHLHRV